MAYIIQLTRYSDVSVIPSIIEYSVPISMAYKMIVHLIQYRQDRMVPNQHGIEYLVSDER